MVQEDELEHELTFQTSFGLILNRLIILEDIKLVRCPFLRINWNSSKYPMRNYHHFNFKSCMKIYGLHSKGYGYQYRTQKPSWYIQTNSSWCIVTRSAFNSSLKGIGKFAKSKFWKSTIFPSDETGWLNHTK